jgi:hypothetical protein
VRVRLQLRREVEQVRKIVRGEVRNAKQVFHASSVTPGADAGMGQSARGGRAQVAPADEIADGAQKPREIWPFVA